MAEEKLLKAIDQTHSYLWNKSAGKRDRETLEISEWRHRPDTHEVSRLLQWEVIGWQSDHSPELLFLFAATQTTDRKPRYVSPRQL